jgi:hypothetical protein
LQVRDKYIKQETNMFYVYAYLRTNELTPYYIGKGKDNRAWQKSHSVVRPSNKDRIVIIARNLTEFGAFALERRMIRWYGRKDLGTGILRNKTDGGDGSAGIIPWNKGTQTGSFLTEKGRRNISNANKGKSKTHKADHNIGSPGVSKSDEHKRKISDSLKGNVPWNKGKTGVQKTTRKGTKCSNETKEKMSLAHKGIKNTAEQKAKISAKLKGRVMSEETKEKMSLAKKQYWENKRNG